LQDLPVEKLCKVHIFKQGSLTADLELLQPNLWCASTTVNQADEGQYLLSTYAFQLVLKFDHLKDVGA
jgi:hypothetical protein